MALLLCPECGKSVSSEAPTCPSCGFPINPGKSEFQRFRKRIVTYGTVMSAIGVVAGLLLELPIIVILGVFGLLVGPLKLALMRK